MRITGHLEVYFDRRDPDVDAMASKLGLAWGEDLSTRYYRLEEPFTSIHVEEGEHDRVTLWERGANVGTLTVSKGTGRMLALLLSDRDHDDLRVPMRTVWGGKERGAVVYENEADLPDDLTLVSEHGDVMTVREIRARAGHVRKDGMPGELLGYAE